MSSGAPVISTLAVNERIGAIHSHELQRAICQGHSQKKAQRGFVGYPLATIAYCGSDDKRATKVAVGIVLGENEEPASMHRWLSAAIDARKNHEINEEILKLIRAHEVKSIAMLDRIVGCPHEEGIDYPEGEKCPACPFWANRDRWSGTEQ